MAAVPRAETAKWKMVTCDPDKCTGCTVCEYICSLTKEKAFSAQKSRIRTMRLHPLVNISIACRLCSPAPCVTACPRDSLKQSEQTGVIIIDDEKCDGCSWCIEACDYGAVLLHPEKKVVVVCDLCEGEPKCVELCPKDALELRTTEEVSQKIRSEAVRKLLTEEF